MCTAAVVLADELRKQQHCRHRRTCVCMHDGAPPPPCQEPTGPPWQTQGERASCCLHPPLHARIQNQKQYRLCSATWAGTSWSTVRAGRSGPSWTACTSASCAPAAPPAAPPTGGPRTSTWAPLCCCRPTGEAPPTLLRAVPLNAAHCMAAATAAPGICTPTLGLRAAVIYVASLLLRASELRANTAGESVLSEPATFDHSRADVGGADFPCAIFFVADDSVLAKHIPYAPTPVGDDPVSANCAGGSSTAGTS